MDEVVDAFLALDSVCRYRQAQGDFLADNPLQQKIQDFQEHKQHYKTLEPYARFRPEVRQLRRQVFQEKRQLDLEGKVSALRQHEVALQQILAELAQTIATAFSADIFIDSGLPLASHHKPHQCQLKGVKSHV